eukprot:EC692291.1.p1 GENE.EC692291.1~~EC692291.1.p1  ORF type:complete len:160 (+),score=50.42 EC692291.1:163-642(+)
MTEDKKRASVVYGNILAHPEKLREMVQHLLDKYDLDGNGTIELREFRNMMDDLFERLQFDEEDKLTEEEAREKFRELDHAGTGSITTDSLLPLAAELLDTMREKFEELESELASVKDVIYNPKAFMVRGGSLLRAGRAAHVLRRMVGRIARTRTRTHTC